jgi:DNA replication protein DnaC
VRRLLTYTLPDVLILDDFGLKPLWARGLEDFLALIDDLVRTPDQKSVGD